MFLFTTGLLEHLCENNGRATISSRCAFADLFLVVARWSRRRILPVATTAAAAAVFSSSLQTNDFGQQNYLVGIYVFVDLNSS